MSPPRVPRFNKMAPPRERPNRNLATGAAPAATQGQSQRQLECITYFTKPGETKMLYSGDRQWAIVKLTLETAGPVVVGQRQNLTPVLSGLGVLLRTGVERAITIARGDRLYIASTSVNRVQVVIEAAPWLEQIAGSINVGLAHQGK